MLLQMHIYRLKSLHLASADPKIKCASLCWPTPCRNSWHHLKPCSRNSYSSLSPAVTVLQLLYRLIHAFPQSPTLTHLRRGHRLSAPSGNLPQLYTHSPLWVPFPPYNLCYYVVLTFSVLYKQSLHSATWPRRKSLQGQMRLNFGECPAQLKRSGSRWRPHSRRTTEKAGRTWLISESTTSHCTSSLRGETER